MKLFVLILSSFGVALCSPSLGHLRLCAPKKDSNQKDWFLFEGTADEKCPHPLISVKFDNQTFRTGWSFVDVKVIDGSLSLADQGYAMGFAEATATLGLITNYRKNMIDDFCTNAEDFCEKLYEFLEKNLHWLNYNIENTHQDRSYWDRVNMMLQQVYGMIDGYEGVWHLKMTNRQIVRHPVYLMQIFGDLEDLKEKFGYPEKEIRTSRSHCSALVKVLPNQDDILFSHITWTSYASMLRVQKKYSYATEDDGREMAFSGYPGVITSIDDFVVTKARLAILETTIMNHNESLWNKIVPESVLYFYRAPVAHLMANSGKEWTSTFSKFNSGTYNNQWMVVDYKQFRKGTDVQKPGLFTLLEQMPGLVVIDDLTDKLMQRGFWPGYNRAYFPKIFGLSEAPKMVKKYGNWYSYDKAPRALIFERDQHTVTDLNSMMRLMRSNNYTLDPFSRCNCNPPYSAESAIAARSELNDPNGRYPIKDLGFMDQGATDAKITNSTMVRDLQFMAVAGPPGGRDWGYNLPEFTWERSILAQSVPHHGQPIYWRFNPVVYTWPDRQ